MKKWLYPAALLAAIGILVRLPHPAKDITKLKPVRAVYLFMDGGMLSLETDTGDSGSGHSLTEAAENLRSEADGEIFLDTAEFLILAPNVIVGEDFFTLLRPDCRVICMAEKPDLENVSDYLSVHKPKTTLNQLRAQKGAAHASETAYSMAPGGDGCAAGPLFRLGLAR